MAAFPFPHEVLLEAALTAERLTITTRIRATGDVAGSHQLRLPSLPAPAGRRPRRLAGRAPGARHLLLDERGIPSGETEPCGPPPRSTLADRHFDDGYDRLPDGAAFSLSGGARRSRSRSSAATPSGRSSLPPGRRSSASSR